MEYQNLNFNLKQFESNLISVIAFHVYVILGMDADTFEFNGGQDYFNVARDIANYSQNANIKGWGPARGGDQSRRVLIDQIMSNTFSEFRTALYEYHRNGLDYMFSDRKKAKNSIAKAIINKNKNKSIYSVVGGGDTITVINQINNIKNFDFVSTAGGAFLEYLEGKELPGIKALN